MPYFYFEKLKQIFPTYLFVMFRLLVLRTINSKKAIQSLVLMLNFNLGSWGIAQPLNCEALYFYF